MYNKVEKLRIDGLKTEHVRIILLSVPTRRMDHWYACREGNMEWRPITEITEFYEDVRILKGPPAESDSDTKSSPKHRIPPPKPTAPPLKRAPETRRPLFEDAPDDATGPEITLVTKNTKERRSTRRFPRQLNFTVTLGANTFTCETHDISTHGLSLREPLPAWVPRSFRAKLTHMGTDIRIMCNQVTHTKLQIVDSESWEVIRQWIVKMVV